MTDDLIRFKTAENLNNGSIVWTAFKIKELNVIRIYSVIVHSQAEPSMDTHYGSY